MLGGGEDMILPLLHLVNNFIRLETIASALPTWSNDLVGHYGSKAEITFLDNSINQQR